MIVLFACCMQLVVGSLSRVDLARARQIVPNPLLTGEEFWTMSEAINTHLSAIPGLSTKPCSRFHLNELHHLLWLLYSTRHTELSSLYVAAGDNRQFPVADASELETMFAADQLLAKQDHDGGQGHDILRDGRCHTAVMLYAHHLSSSAREEAHQHIVLPLLPVTAHSLEANLIAPTLEIKQIYQDSLNCAKCHLSPSSKPLPSQSYYEAAQHADLVEPKELRSENGTLNVTLHVGISRSRGPLSFNTRTYNGDIPGPTLRVKAGDTLLIRVVNTLGEQQQAPSQSNLYRLPNTTNLHLHGLWLKPHDVFSGIDPGCTRDYKYKIPAEHAAGSNWYHPHFHGSSSLQLVNGMAGMLIVEDDVSTSTRPNPVESMGEHVMVLQQVPIYSYKQLDVLCTTNSSSGISNCHDLDGAGSLLTMRSFSGDQLALRLQVNDRLAGSLGPGGGNNYFTVNGDFQPKISIKPGEWRRLRLLNAAHQSSLSLILPGCETLILAMDGVYLQSPRPKNTSAPIVLPPGSRSDVAVMCGSRGKFALRSNENPDPINLGQQTGFYSGILALLDVAGEAVAMHPPSQLPALPEYLRGDLPTQKNAPVISARWDIVKVINNTAGLTDVPVS